MTDEQDKAFGPEFGDLKPEVRQMVREMVSKTAQDDQARAMTIDSRSDIYAYPHPGGGIAWGCNLSPQGFNSHRGIWRPIAND